MANCKGSEHPCRESRDGEPLQMRIPIKVMVPGIARQILYRQHLQFGGSIVNASKDSVHYGAHWFVGTNVRIAKLCTTFLHLAGHDVTIYEHPKKCLHALRLNGGKECTSNASVVRTFCDCMLPIEGPSFQIFAAPTLMELKLCGNSSPTPNATIAAHFVVCRSCFRDCAGLAYCSASYYCDKTLQT